jgi:hypothetical protein
MFAQRGSRVLVRGPAIQKPEALKRAMDNSVLIYHNF